MDMPSPVSNAVAVNSRPNIPPESTWLTATATPRPVVSAGSTPGIPSPTTGLLRRQGNPCRESRSRYNKQMGRWVAQTHLCPWQACGTQEGRQARFYRCHPQEGGVWEHTLGGVHSAQLIDHFPETPSRCGLQRLRWCKVTLPCPRLATPAGPRATAEPWRAGPQAGQERTSSSPCKLSLRTRRAEDLSLRLTGRTILKAAPCSDFWAPFLKGLRKCVRAS